MKGAGRFIKAWIFQQLKLNLFENVVEAGSTIVVWLSSLPGFPANNQVKMLFEMCVDVFII